MTPSEVLEKLGPAAEASRPEPARQLMLADGTTPDVQAAVEMANRIAAAAEPNEQTPKTVAAKTIRDLIRHRTWKGRLYASPTEERPLRSISGELETLSGRSHQMVHEYVVVRTRNKRAAQVALLRSSLDQKSSNYLNEVERAVYDLTELLMDEERKALAAAPLDPRLIRIKPVVIRGITLVPSVGFEDGKLSAISLGTAGRDNPTTPYNPGWPGMYRSLCDELSSKYGPPDEEGRGEIGPRAKWKFPDCQISCGIGRFGIGVLYRKLDETDAKTEGL